MDPAPVDDLGACDHGLPLQRLDRQIGVQPTGRVVVQHNGVEPDPGPPAPRRGRVEQFVLDTGRSQRITERCDRLRVAVIHRTGQAEDRCPGDVLELPPAEQRLPGQFDVVQVGVGVPEDA